MIDRTPEQIRQLVTFHVASHRTYRDLVELSGTVGNPPPKPPQAEAALRHRQEYYVEKHELHIRVEGYDGMLLRHYLEGCPHPDDLKLPLNEWESLP